MYNYFESKHNLIHEVFCLLYR
ncbi:hypothetical protein RCO48_17650 [Peribacillus frigoritolerans]|nr:hypothetical protein [Peribacillus frigoritolerans]